MRAAAKPRARGFAPASRFVLPVSGATVVLRQPTGAEDMLLAEQRADDATLALALAERLGEATPSVVWADLPVPDIDALIVRLRQAIVGDRVIADVTCGSASCGQRVDLSFGLAAYLAHHGPGADYAGGRGWSVAASADEPGWYSLRAADAATVAFRLPTLADQIAVDGLPDAPAALLARCVHPAAPPARERRRVEAAMAALAPPLAGALQGRCPNCGTEIAARFEARRYCLQELRDRARFVYDDVDTLAERYHWSERAILTLPHARRVGYAERARQARVA